MKKYVALDGHGQSLVTVIASSEREARARIREQLDRPGRREFFAQWVAGGAVVVEKEAQR